MTLVFLAAGLGSRFKDGLKQLAKVGPNNETIMELSIKDAKKIGFNKVIFIIRREIEDDFKKLIIPNIDMDYEFVYQENNLREKPLGTAHALLSLKDKVKGKFVILNCDDYYGYNALENIYKNLGDNVAMMAYKLKNTVFTKEPVNRGVCEVEDNKLIDIKETKGISKQEDGYYVSNNKLDENTLISMNMWGFNDNIFPRLEEKYQEFLKTLDEDNEFLIPSVIKNMINNGETIDVLITDDKCLGITYKEDIQLFKDIM